MVTKWSPLPIKEGGTDGTTPKSARRALGISEGVSSDNFVSVKDFPFGAVGDGVTDDTAAFNATEALPASVTYIYVPDGTYITTLSSLAKRYYGPGVISLNGVLSGSSGKYSFAGIVNFPGATQLNQISWNTTDIFLYRNGLGRFGIQIKPDGTLDSAVDINTTVTSGQGSNRLRIWSYDGLGSTAQWYTEITTSRDIGFEGSYFSSRVAGASTARPIFFQTGVTSATQFKIVDTASAVQFLEVTGSPTGVGRPTIRGNGTDAAIGILFAGKGTTADFLFQSDFLGTPVNQFQVVPGAGSTRWLTVSGSTTNPVLDATAGAIKLSSGTADIQWGKANVALGGGAAPTVGTIGGSGPAAAGQRNWLRFIESDGTASFIPVWR